MKRDRTSTLPADARVKVRHAVFPVAGFGAHFLPATKACPKEMLPIIDRPMIQCAVEEAAAAGLTRMIFITGRGKRAIEDHFDRAYELEHELTARDDVDALKHLRSAVPAGVTFSYIRQREPTGLVDALRMARPLIGNDPFAVLLPDQIFDAKRSALSQLLDVFDEHRLSVVGAERVPSGIRDGSHVIGADLRTSSLPAARALVRVPPIDASFDSFATAGRFVFTPAAWSAFEHVADARLSDASLASAIRNLMERERVFACLIDGRRFDCGSMLGYLEAQVAFARKRPDLWNGLRRSLDDFADGSPGREHVPTRSPNDGAASLPTDASA
jgi:UTP--glucose-1-phosphate uridylyltransferase